MFNTSRSPFMPQLILSNKCCVPNCLHEREIALEAVFDCRRAPFCLRTHLLDNPVHVTSHCPLSVMMTAPGLPITSVSCSPWSALPAIILCVATVPSGLEIKSSDGSALQTQKDSIRHFSV